jgi:hypothetical protein
MKAKAMRAHTKDPLDQAFKRLERVLPLPLARALHWMHLPQARWVRIPLGILCIAASVFWFLPVVGLEFLPVGLLLIAQDVPFLRRPVGRMMLWLLDRMGGVKRWWSSWRNRHRPHDRRKQPSQ